MGLTGTVQPVGFSPSSETPTPPEDFYAVLYVPQNLSPSQKAQAIANIGALTVSDIANLLESASFDINSRLLTFQRKNGTAFSFDLSSNEGVEDISLDGNNDIQISYLNGSNSLINLSGLLSVFIKTVNGKAGTDIVIDIDDIANLRLELNSRVPIGTTIEVDGNVQDLQQNPVFFTNAVKYQPQTPTPQEQQYGRDNLDTYSKTEENNAISNATAFTKGVFTHLLTAQDIANPIMTFTLPDVPNMNQWEFLYIGSGPLSPDSYSVAANVLSIDQSKIGYEVQAGRSLTFRYMY